jgi:hypothetical protein
MEEVSRLVLGITLDQTEIMNAVDGHARHGGKDAQIVL